MTPDEITALLLLRCGALPHPELPDYDGWYGGGFGLDMLDDMTLLKHGENVTYIKQAKEAAQELGIAPEAFRAFIENQRRG